MLAPLTESETRWNIAQHPDNSLPRLTAIGVLPIDDIDGHLDSAQDDIGNDDPDGLPKQEGESSLGNALRKLGNLPQKSLLKGILKLTGSATEGAGSATWINRLENWAGKNLSSLMEKQNHQLDRLLDLLKKDPDRG